MMNCDPKGVANQLLNGGTMPGIGLVGMLCLAAAIGCSPPPPTVEDLGQIVYDPSQVPGADRPYTLPHGLGEEAPPGIAEEPTDTPETPKPASDE